MMAVNKSLVCPANGVKLSGEAKISAVAAGDWFTFADANDIVIQFLLNGSTSAHCAVNLEACLLGGKAVPKVIASADSSDTATDKMVTVTGVAYDLYRINVTAYTASGLNSEVLMSARS